MLSIKLEIVSYNCKKKMTKTKYTQKRRVNVAKLKKKIVKGIV